MSRPTTPRKTQFRANVAVPVLHRETSDRDKGPLNKILHSVALLQEAIKELGVNDGTISKGNSTHSNEVLPPHQSFKNNGRSPSGFGLQPTGQSDKLSEQPKLLPRWNEIDNERVHASRLNCMDTLRTSSIRESLRQSLSQVNGHLGLQTEKYFTWACHPQSKQRIAWDVFSVMFIAWDLLLVPLHTFNLKSIVHLLDIADWCVTTFWTLDIIMQLRTGFYSKQSVVLDPKSIVIRYAKSWMAIDVSIVALEWVMCIGENTGGGNALRFQRFRVFARYVRGTRIAKFVHFASKIKAGMRSFYLLLGFSLLKIVLALMVLCHYLACGWHAVGQWSADGWVYREELPENDFYSLVFLYMSASRWTLAQINGRTDLADDRTLPERCYTSMCAFFTVVFYSLFISALTTRMVELLGLRAEVQKGMRVLNAFVHRHKLSRNTVYFARQYVMNHQNLKNESDTEKELLELLPDHLQWDLVYEIRSPTLTQHPFMKDLDSNFKSAFRHLLATTMSNVYTRVLEVVFEPGLPCTRVLFHTEGQIRYEWEGTYKNALHQKIQEIAPEPSGRLIRAATRVLQRTTCEDAVDVGKEVPITSCLSEAAFWIEWKHKGALLAVASSKLLAMDVRKFSAGLAHHVGAEARAAVYAINFAVKMNDGWEILDLMDADFGALNLDQYEDAFDKTMSEASLRSGTTNFGDESETIPEPRVSKAAQAKSRRICPCGNRLMPDAVFCRKCGKRAEAPPPNSMEFRESSGRDSMLSEQAIVEVEETLDDEIVGSTTPIAYQSEPTLAARDHPESTSAVRDQSESTFRI